MHDEIAPQKYQNSRRTTVFSASVFIVRCGGCFDVLECLMPQRFLRPGLRNSDRWNSISRDAQATYIALLTLVDDYGQYDGRAAVILADCFAVWNDKNPDKCIDSAGIRRILQELAAVGLIELKKSSSGLKDYLQVTQWQERVRQGYKPKWSEDGLPQESAGIRSGILPPLTIKPLTIKSLTITPFTINHLPKTIKPLQAKCACAAEKELLSRIKAFVGPTGMIQNGGMYRKLIRENPAKSRRVLEDMEAQNKEGKKFSNPGGFFVDTYKRFK